MYRGFSTIFAKKFAAHFTPFFVHFIQTRHSDGTNHVLDSTTSSFVSLLCHLFLALYRLPRPIQPTPPAARFHLTCPVMRTDRSRPSMRKDPENRVGGWPLVGQPTSHTTYAEK